jgi:nicotinamidase-related amidase
MKKVSKTTIYLILGFLWIAGVGIAQEDSKKMKPALIVIDIQDEYILHMCEEDRKTAPEMINAAIQLFREHNYPVIRVYHSDPKWGPKPGTNDFQFLDTILVKEDDPQIIKNYGNAFINTDLEKVLRERGCNTLFLCGLSATGCVLATYFGAQDHDFTVFMIKGALLSPRPEYTAAIQDIYKIVDYTTLKYMLDKAQK